jgi:hypothetical protein
MPLRPGELASGSLLAQPAQLTISVSRFFPKKFIG